jgi:hypothetical protein
MILRYQLKIATIIGHQLDAHKEKTTTQARQKKGGLAYWQDGKFCS